MLRTCWMPYIPQCTVHCFAVCCTASRHRPTNCSYSWDPVCLSTLPWYCMLRPLTRPPSVACGTIRMSPGSSKIETNFESPSLSRMLSAVFTKMQQKCRKKLFIMPLYLHFCWQIIHTHHCYFLYLLLNIKFCKLWFLMKFNIDCDI